MSVEMRRDRVMIALKDLVRIVRLVPHGIDFPERHVSN